MNPFEARTAANVAYRATRLFRDGYTVEAWGEGTGLYVMTSPAGKHYIVDTDKETCTCPYYTDRNEGKAEEKKVSCKHLQGIDKLILDSEAAACEMDTETYLRWKEYEENR